MADNYYYNYNNYYYNYYNYFNNNYNYNSYNNNIHSYFHSINNSTDHMVDHGEANKVSRLRHGGPGVRDVRGRLRRVR